jgi:hypothetical protein
MVAAVLQYNENHAAHAHARRAHAAHAAVVSLHALCCGAPVALLLLSAGAATGVLGSFVTRTHAFLHGHELWLLAISATLILAGGYAEWRSRRAGARGFPALFALSILCLVANVAIIAVHRL